MCLSDLTTRGSASSSSTCSTACARPGAGRRWKRSRRRRTRSSGDACHAAPVSWRLDSGAGWATGAGGLRGAYTGHRGVGLSGPLRPPHGRRERKVEQRCDRTCEFASIGDAKTQPAVDGAARLQFASRDPRPADQPARPVDPLAPRRPVSPREPAPQHSLRVWFCATSSGAISRGGSNPRHLWVWFTSLDSVRRGVANPRKRDTPTPSMPPLTVGAHTPPAPGTAQRSASPTRARRNAPAPRRRARA